MTYFDAVLLGIIQGLTEFLPISSSGHLVLTQELLGVNQPGLTFELLVHFGTLLSVLIYFRRPIIRLVQALYRPDMKEERRILLYLVIGTIPAGLVGVLLEDYFERAFASPLFTAFMLIVTGCILFSTRLARGEGSTVGLKSAVVMGIGQAFAILPGISRSGSTIAAGILSGVKPDKAAEFSFLLAIPAIAGALVLEFDSLISLDSALLGQYLAGTLASFVFGLAAVYVVLATIRRGKFEYFAYYCFAAGVVGVYIFW